MNATGLLKATSAHGGPAIFGAGAAMLAAALVTSGHGQPEATARPTSTVTVTASPAPVAAPRPGPTKVPRPKASASGPRPTVAVAVSDRRAAMPHTSDGGTSHAEARPPSAPQQSPAAAACGGSVLSVQALQSALCVSLGR